MSNKEIGGYSNLRIGFILTSLAEITLFVWFVIVLNAVFQFVSKIYSSNLSTSNLTIVSSLSSSEIESLATSIGSTIWIEILGVILGIIATIFLYLGFRKEKGIISVGKASAGAILVLISFLLFPIISLLAIIIGIIGFILMKGALDSIGNKYNEGLVNNGAILSIIPIISIIGAILVAIGLTKVIGRAKEGQVSLQPTVSQPIQQIGLGVIKDNGEIFLTLNSQVQGTIVSAKIEGTQYATVLSIPLNVGYNNVAINMGMPITLVRFSIYRITLVISTTTGVISVSVDAIYNP